MKLFTLALSITFLFIGCHSDESDKSNEASSNVLKADRNIKQSMLFGYTDEKGNLKIDYQFDMAHSFQHGSALVQKSDSFFLIDKTGTRISAVYESVKEFDKTIPWKVGYRSVHDTLNAFIINQKGEELIGNVLDFYFNDDKLVATKKNSVNGSTSSLNAIVDTTTWVFSDFYKTIMFLQGDEKSPYIATGNDAIEDISGKYCLINQAGERISDWYEDLMQDKNNLFFHVSKSEKWPERSKYGLLNQQGELVVPMLFDHSCTVYDKVIVTANSPKNSLAQGLYSASGKELKKTIYSEINVFGELIHIVEKNNYNYFLYDNSNATLNLIAGPFDLVSLGSRSRGKLAGRWSVSGGTAYYTGNEVNSELICVSKQGKYGFMNYQGEIVIPIEYDKFEGSMHSGVFKVFKGKQSFELQQDGQLKPQ